MAKDFDGTKHTDFRSLDGLRLRGTLSFAASSRRNPTVLVHGGGVTRDEGGFFVRLAAGLAEAGSSTLRFDFRAHGESAGRQEDLTISGVLNDIRAAAEHVREATSAQPVNLIGASFGGGISAFFAARHPELTQRLVLFNPLLNYKKRFVDDKPYWHDDHLSREAGRELAESGSLKHSPTFKLGRPLLNEVFHLQPHQVLNEISMPTLIVHGTADTFIPVESSRDALRQIKDAQLVEIEGAQHGFALHDDPQYLDPQTQAWQAHVIRTVTDWLTRA
ncbi:alpha/beta hydrolase [Actinomadura scrupuli]|uniref:alpha/beta hydrolase n=1 Tax=Actinomadura scrupuli TaxID=559629 RepID=UPI003D96AE51